MSLKVTLIATQAGMSCWFRLIIGRVYIAVLICGLQANQQNKGRYCPEHAPIDKKAQLWQERQ